MKNSEYLYSRKESEIGKGHITEELCDFYCALYTLQEEYEELFSNETMPSFIRKKDLPAIDPGGISLKRETLEMFHLLLKKLVSLICGYHKGLDMDKLTEHFKKDQSGFERSLSMLLLRDVDNLDKFAKEIKIGTEELLFIVINLFKPYLVSLQKKTAIEINYREWDSPLCPFCGSYADMSKIVEEKENICSLHCPLCEKEWNYRRLSCTICENQDSETLGYFFSEEDPINRFYYCDKCKGYIKTIRIPKEMVEDRFNLTVENLLTSRIDASAIEMGYKRP